MYYSRKTVFSLIFLLAILPELTIADIDWIYERNKNIYCEYYLCHFNIYNDNPFSPLIPYQFIPKARYLGDYHYIYLIFERPKSTEQKTFFLEVNDVKKDETLITGGDCYKIDLDKNVQYELQIFKPLNKDTLVQLKFIGLNPNFFHIIELKFILDLGIYANSIKLAKFNSLWKKEQQGLIDYLEKSKQNVVKEEKIKNEALEKTKKILKGFLRKESNISIKEIHNYASFIFPTNFAIISVSIRYSLGVSTDRFFTDDEIIISEKFYAKGFLMSQKNILSFLGDDVVVLNDIKNLVELIVGGIDKFIFGIDFGNDYYSFTVSTCYGCKYVNFIFRFYDPINNNIYLEIDVKIEFINNNLFKPLEEFFDKVKKAVEKEIDKIKQHPFLFGLQIGIAIGLYLAGGVVKEVGGGIIKLIQLFGSGLSHPVYAPGLSS